MTPGPLAPNPRLLAPGSWLLTPRSSRGFIAGEPVRNDHAVARFLAGLLALPLSCLPLASASAAPPGGNAVRVADADGLRQAARAAGPGTVLLLEPGEYRGSIWLENLHGTLANPIVIAAANPARRPVFRGTGECLHLSRVTHLELRDLEFQGATGNGLNIDDGGRPEPSTHHITLRRLRVSDIGPKGNRDGIKLSGVTDFLVEDCVVERWGSGGSGIDMVGCQRGRIVACLFRDGGSEGVQAKGGSAEIRIEQCRFLNPGGRGVNIGGSTGSNYFRPRLDTLPPGRRAEARDVTIERCLFVGGTAPVAFVGADGAVVRRCTFYRPGRWAIRILQETTAAGFVPSRHGRFEENIVVFRSDAWAEGGVNIGPRTAPETFQFNGNVWFCEDRPERSAPRLPSPENGAILGRDPLFRDPAAGDFTLQPGSPARGRGCFDETAASPELPAPAKPNAPAK